ncbi:MAG: NADH-quinone oxidoreductase subunit M [Actinomycetales bacterium]
MNFPWLTVIGVLPLVGAAVCVLLPGDSRWLARQLALAFSLLSFVGVVAVAVQFDLGAAGTAQFTEQHSWIAPLGVSYALGVTGISLVMLLLAAALTPVCVLASWHVAGDDPAKVREFFALILAAESFILGVFMARDVFMFYMFFEAMLIPMYFLIGRFGGQQGKSASMKFLLFSLTGGLIMLAGVIAIGFSAVDPVTGGLAPDAYLVDNLTGLTFSSVAAERWMFLSFFIAFAIKAPMWPVHTWLPDAAAAAPPAVSVLLVGVLDKVGTYGMIVLCLPLFPEASQWAAPVIAALAVVSIVYGGLVAIAQRDLRRLIAFTSVSHFGFIILGIFAMTSTAQSGAVLYMLNHGFSTAALFGVCAMLMARFGTARIGEYGGIQRVTPVLAGMFLLAGLSSLALPGMSSFISEFLVLAGTFARYPAAAVLATSGLVLSALYILLTYQRMATGPTRPGFDTAPDLSARERWVLGPVIAVIIVLGFFPKPVLEMINPAVAETMTTVGVVDPAPVLEGADQ